VCLEMGGKGGAKFKKCLGVGVEVDGGREKE
jgi:hypothetical protein